jgi:hypothetical protein
MSANTSPQLLANLFARFQRRAQAEAGVKMSMRKVSEDLLSPAASVVAKSGNEASTPAGKKQRRTADVNALGRWTRPGGRHNWFIPIGRVLDVARRMGATEEERDALMLARLAEIAEQDPKHDVLVCGAWVAERVSRQHELDADEQAVLDAFRRSRAVSPYSTLSSSRLAKLERLFGELAREHLAELALESADAAHEADMSPDDEARLRAKRTAVMAPLRATRTLVRKPVEVSAEVVARRFLRELRKKMV